jgi:hypothetical protein
MSFVATPKIGNLHKETVFVMSELKGEHFYAGVLYILDKCLRRVLFEILNPQPWALPA